MLLGTYGCTDDSDKVQTGRTLRVDVNVVADLATRSAATAEEKRVERFDLYLFDAETGLLEQTALGVTPVVSDRTVAGEIGIGNVEFELQDAREKQLLAVANAAEEKVRMPEIRIGATTYAEMQESEVRHADGTRPETPLVMAGYAGRIAADRTGATVSLTRRVAKLSVENRDSKGNLLVTSLKLRRAVGRCPLFKTDYAANDADRIDYATLETDLENGASATFYLLPQSAETNAVLLDIAGRLYGAPFTQTLEVKPLGADGSALDIEPNSHYTVALTAEGRAVKVSVGVLSAGDWNDGAEIAGVITGSGSADGRDVSFNGLEWMDRNLGAETADFENDWTAARGAFYQWGRNTAFVPDGYTTVGGPLSAEEAAASAGAFITKMSGDWLSPSDDTLWASAEKQPCPEGYRLPTAQEYFGIIPSSGVLFNMYNGPKIVAGESLPSGSATAHYFGDNTNKTLYGIKRQGSAEAYLLKWEYLKTAAGNAYARISRWPGDAGDTFSGKSLSEVRDEFDALGEAPEILTLPAAGYITGSSGAYTDNRGGYYWASSPNGSGAWRVEITDGKMVMTTPYNSRVSGHSLRCVRR